MGFFRTQEEKELEETTGGGFKRIRPTFLEKSFEYAKAKAKEHIDFNKQLAEARRKAYRKERIKLAKKKGRERARKIPFSNLKINKQVMKGKKEKREKSNIERLLGI